MDLVVHQMVQLQHIDVANCHLALERLAGAAVNQHHLSAGIQPRRLQHLLNIRHARAVEHRRRNGDALLQVGRKLNKLLLVQRRDLIVEHALAINVA